MGPSSTLSLGAIVDLGGGTAVDKGGVLRSKLVT